MPSNKVCTGGQVESLLPQAELERIRQLRADGVSWTLIVAALRRAGYTATVHGMSRHFREACQCKALSEAKLVIEFTPLGDLS